MQIKGISIQHILFVYQPYPITLKKSLLRAGVQFPLQVRMQGDRYICLDGHKRLSAIQDILQEDATHPKFQSIRVQMVEHARSAPPWHTHNLH